ncbi:MAG TPA: AMP-binding protein [Azospirillum sp.]|nr:AMP-binding protein [Azospirillum sp.]
MTSPAPLAALFVAAALARPDKPALRVGAQALTYGALMEAARRVAAGVAALPGASPRVAVQLGNRAEFLEIFLGTVLAGGTVALLDPKWSAAQRQAALGLVQPAALFDDPDAYRAWRDTQPAGEPFASVGPETPFLIGFTSGTTGRPKAFIRSQASWVATLEASRAEFAIGPDDGILVPGPLVHGLGLYAAVEGLAAGAVVHVLSRFDAAAALDALEEHALTTLVAVPTMLVALVEEATRRGLRLPAVRRVIASGAKLAPAVHERLASAFPEAGVFEYYGASELSFVSVAPSREGVPFDSVGRAFHGVELEIRTADGRPAPRGEVGAVWVRSGMLSAGYIGPADGVGFRAEGGWATVGDRGWIDEHGWLRLIGREGDMLISGGLNVYPAEVEGVLRAHPLVAEAVVLGLPDPYWGDAVTAVLWWRGAERASPAELRAWCHTRLEGYKCPRRVFAARDMPLTGSGKIARAQVRAWALAGDTSLEELA